MKCYILFYHMLSLFLGCCCRSCSPLALVIFVFGQTETMLRCSRYTISSGTTHLSSARFIGFSFNVLFRFFYLAFVVLCVFPFYYFHSIFVYICTRTYHTIRHKTHTDHINTETTFSFSCNHRLDVNIVVCLQPHQFESFLHFVSSPTTIHTNQAKQKLILYLAWINYDFFIKTFYDFVLMPI